MSFVAYSLSWIFLVMSSGLRMPSMQANIVRLVSRMASPPLVIVAAMPGIRAEKNGEAPLYWLLIQYLPYTQPANTNQHPPGLGSLISGVAWASGVLLYECCPDASPCSWGRTAIWHFFSNGTEFCRSSGLHPSAAAELEGMHSPQFCNRADQCRTAQLRAAKGRIHNNQ
jgi:hypothetical protein